MNSTSVITPAGTSDSHIDHVVTTASLSYSSTSINDSSSDFSNSSWPILPNVTADGKDFFHHLTPKDETAFVALIIMGVIVPAIFITVFILICRQRRKDLIARRTQMLLQNTQDFALEDYTSMEKAASPPPRL